MSRESRVFISRLIVVAIYGFSILAAVFNEFLISLSIASVGLMFWLIYLLSAGLGNRDEQDPRTFASAIARVIAGLGGILAISAFSTYGMEQTMFGGYTFNVLGLALGVMILVLTLAPLVILHLLSAASDIPGTPRQTASEAPAAEPASQIMPAEAPTPTYPYGYDYEEEEEFDDEEEDDDQEEYAEEDDDWEDDDEDEEDETEEYEA